MEPFELRGNGLLLAVPTVDDIGSITEYCQDPEVQRWVTSIPVPYQRSNAWTFVTEVVPAGWKDESMLTWAIRDPETRRVLGAISIRIQQAGRASIGFWAAPEARGRKVVSRAVRLVAEYAFDSTGLGLSHLQWYALAGNWASRRVAWATGFRWDGTIRGWHPNRGERSDAWFATLKAGEPMEPATQWLRIPELWGTNVVLRPFADSDANAVVEACSDPLTQHWLSALPSPYTTDDAETFIFSRFDEPAAGKAVHWAAAMPEGGPAVGAFSLMGLNTRSGGAEVGYWVHPKARGTGVATEAVGLMLRHAFAAKDDGGLGLRRIVVAHADGNDASRKPIERNGFQLIGAERAEHRFRDGTIADLRWYDILSDEFHG